MCGRCHAHSSRRQEFDNANFPKIVCVRSRHPLSFEIARAQARTGTFENLCTGTVWDSVSWSVKVVLVPGAHPMCDCNVSSLCVSRHPPVFLTCMVPSSHFPSLCLIHTFEFFAEFRMFRREMSAVDDGTRAAKARCRRSASRSAVDRRACVSAYLAKKAIGANDSVAESVARSGPRRCATPSDSMSDADRVEMARCLRAMALHLL